MGDGRNGNRIRAWLLAIGMTLVLCGCRAVSSSTESLLRPPLADKEQTAVLAALEDYLGAQADSPGYTLKYPESGDYMSAFVREDLDGDGQEEVVCFYCLRSANEKTHLNLLRRTDEGWISISDVEGEGTDVSFVAFGDLQGDGRPELLTGWNVYSSNQDRRLVLYSLETGRLMRRYTAIYSAVAVGDLTASRRDSLMLFSIDSARRQVTANLITLQGQGVIQLGQVQLDSSIRSFGKATVCSLTDGVSGVFIDAYKDNDQAITELVYWENQRLVAPFCDETTHLNVRTAREVPRQSHIVSTDINGDGIPEWPRTRRLAGYETAAVKDALFLTTWISWNYTDQTDSPLFDCVVNDADGYYVRLDAAWVGGVAQQDTVSARYTAATHTLELTDIENGKPGQTLLAITPLSVEQEKGSETGMARFQLTLEDGNTYAVSYTRDERYGFNEERIRYLMTVLA